VWDLEVTGDRALVSKAAKVMEKLSMIAIARTPNLVLRDLSINDSREEFAAAFNTLCHSLSRATLLQDIDRRNYGDSSYITFYDMILKDRKRSLAEANEVIV
jgi:hypothetical protein